MPFIQKAKKRDRKSCIFCKAWSSRNDKAQFVVARSKHSMAMLNIFPYNNGHLMIAPEQHTGDFSAITGTQWQDMMMLVGRAQRALERTLHPQGYNVGINLGRAGGAGIEDHIHIHVVPRWSGDSNFMPVLAATKVLPQALSESYDRLARVLRK